MKPELHEDGEEHRKSGTAGSPHPRETCRKCLHGGERRRRNGGEAQKPRKDELFLRGERGIEQGDDGLCEEKQPRRARKGEKKGYAERVERATLARLPLPSRDALRNARHARRGDPVTDRRGDIDEGKRAARIQAVEGDGALRAPEQTDDHHAVRRLGEREKRGRRHHGQHGAEDLRSRNAPCGEQRAAALGEKTKSEAKQRGELGSRDRKQGIRHGFFGRFRKAEREKEPRARLHELLHDLGDRRRLHLVLSLKIAAQHRERRNEKHGRREGIIARFQRNVPLNL